MARVELRSRTESVDTEGVSRNSAAPKSPAASILFPLGGSRAGLFVPSPLPVREVLARIGK